MGAPEIEDYHHNNTAAAKEPPGTKFVPPPPRGCGRAKQGNCRAAYWRRRAICMKKKLATASHEAQEAQVQLKEAQAQLKQLLVGRSTMVDRWTVDPYWAVDDLREERLQEEALQQLQYQYTWGEADDHERMDAIQTGVTAGFSAFLAKAPGGPLSEIAEVFVEGHQLGFAVARALFRAGGSFAGRGACTACWRKLSPCYNFVLDGLRLRQKGGEC